MTNFQQRVAVISGTITFFLFQLLWNNLPQSRTFKELFNALEFNSPALANPLTGDINYTPPDRGAPEGTAAAGARAYETPTIFQTEENWTRGDSTRRGAPTRGESLPKECSQMLPILLVPQDHIGQTTSGHPTFFWYVSDPKLRTLVFTFRKAGETKAIFTEELAVKPGIVTLKMPEEQPQLEQGTIYLWSVSFACKPEGETTMKKFVVEAAIRRIPPTAELTEKLASTTAPQQRGRIYAQQGYWYDALEVLATAAKAEPNNKAAYEDILSLLDKVGLGQVAAKERQQSRN